MPSRSSKSCTCRSPAASERAVRRLAPGAPRVVRWEFRSRRVVRGMSLLLEVSRLPAAGVHIARRADPAEFGATDDFRVAAPVDLDLTARKDGARVRVTGRVRTTVECACSRCLDPFPIAVDA